jgi:hypothetical protein
MVNAARNQFSLTRAASITGGVAKKQSPITDKVGWAYCFLDKTKTSMKKLTVFGMLLGLIVLSGCSKQTAQTTATADTSSEKTTPSNPMPTPEASISLRGVYSISVTTDFAFVVSEFENTGNIGVSAFKGKWTLKDELDETIADQIVRFTSETPFATAEGMKSPHVISPGEKFLIVVQALRGEEPKIYATTKSVLVTLVAFYKPGLTVDSLEDYRSKAKCTFVLEKIVSQ